MKLLLCLTLLTLLTACAGGSNSASSPAMKIEDSPVYQAPQTLSEAEQVFRGEYKEVGIPTNFITVNGNLSASGNMFTHVVLSPWNVNQNCSFTAPTIRARATGSTITFDVITPVTSHSMGGGFWAYDCIANGTYERIEVVSWVSEKCVDLKIGYSTAT